MTGIGALALQLLGEKDSQEATAATRGIIQRKTPTWQSALQDWNGEGGDHMYGWYYDTQAVFQHTGGQGPEWTAYNQLFQSVLIRNQHSEGYWRTDEKHRIGGDSLHGRVLTTCFACLQLEVYYRYLPTFKFAKTKFVNVEGLAEGQGNLEIK
jgi:hypothetical protein